MNIELIHSTIKTVINQFRRKPDNFFNEHDFHQYCYHVFYRKKEFSKQYETLDEKKTNVLHPEYPTLERFRRKPIGRVDSTGVRARYDMVILNPDLIEKNELETIRCRDISKAETDSETKNIFAALEFKFIIRHSLNYLDEIKFDHLKLKHAREVEHKYILVFTNTSERKIEYFEDLRLGNGIKAVYVAPNKLGRKKLEVKEYPMGWLYGRNGDEI
ncbi:MAG: hypothetical protein J7L72_08000 [Candidatus Aminicenantes bacterium]|nr:hypothetical protein [Candidatus Aminicenantes bacterium]